MHRLIIRVIIFSFLLGNAGTVSAGDSRSLSKRSLMTLGQAQYKICAGCHGPDGNGTQYFAPALTNSPVVNGPAYSLISTVIEGVARSGKSEWDAYMPAWSTVFSDVELASIITFIRNSLGNAAGDLVQPDKIKITKILYRAIKLAELPAGVKTCDFSLAHEPIKADNVTIIKVVDHDNRRSNVNGVNYSPVMKVIAKVEGICKYIDKQGGEVKEKNEVLETGYKFFFSEFEFSVYQNIMNEWVVKDVI